MQRKKSRCVVIVSIHVCIAAYSCRYDVDQQINIRYSEVQKSVSKDNTVRDSIYVNVDKPSEPVYEAIEIAHKHDNDIKMDANPAYHATS